MSRTLSGATMSASAFLIIGSECSLEKSRSNAVFAATAHISLLLRATAIFIRATFSVPMNGCSAILKTLRLKLRLQAKRRKSSSGRVLRLTKGAKAAAFFRCAAVRAAKDKSFTRITALHIRRFFHLACRCFALSDGKNKALKSFFPKTKYIL